MDSDLCPEGLLHFSRLANMIFVRFWAHLQTVVHSPRHGEVCYQGTSNTQTFAGLRDEELSQRVGINGAKFVHASGSFF